VRQLGDADPQSFSELSRLSMTTWVRFPADRFGWVRICVAPGTLPRAPPQQVQRFGGRQMPKQCRPITDEFSPVHLHCFQEGVLDAIPCVSMISDEAVYRALHNARVLAYYRFPIGHAQVLVSVCGSID
jgi:hypothetical protein